METLLCNKIWYGECVDKDKAMDLDEAQQFLNLITRALDIFFPSHLEIDRFLTLEALRRTGGSQKEAARLLGIAQRTLRYRLKEYKPYWTDLAEEAEVIRS